MTKATNKLKGGAYKVGFGKPPKEHQFKPGTSGNPNGRPKGAPSLDEIFAREAGRLIKLKQGDEVVHISKIEALVRKVLHKAIEGDMTAAKLVFQMRGQAASADAPDTELELELGLDEDVVKRMLARFRFEPSK